MYDDLLGEKQDNPEMTKDSIISALKANIDEKEEIIKDMINRITELEIQLESYEII